MGYDFSTGEYTPDFTDSFDTYSSDGSFDAGSADYLSSLSESEIDALLALPDDLFTQYVDALDQNWNPAAASVSGGTDWGGLISKGIGAITSPQGMATIGGALLGGMNGSKQTGTQTSTQAPWGPQQSYLTDLFAKAKQASAGGAGSMSPYEMAALQKMQEMVSGPTTNQYAGQDNPYLQKTIDNASQDAMRVLTPAFQKASLGSGSFGNSGLGETFARTASNTLGNIATNARMNDYQTQQGLAENAVNRTSNATGNLFNAGKSSSANPWTNLQNYGSAISGGYGGSTSTPIFTNPASSMLGGGLLGSQIYKNIFGA